MMFIGRKPRRVKVDLNIASLMLPVAHGRNAKDMVVLHETVSPDYHGTSDLLSVARYMPSKGYGIHGIVDAEGFLAWAVYMETSLLYHTASNSGGVNTRAIGIELVSNVMLKVPDNARRWQWWWERHKQIDKTAKVLAYLHRTQGIPLKLSNGKTPGITTHYLVTKSYDVTGGHTDGWPKHRGGYFPLFRFIYRARQYARAGY